MNWKVRNPKFLHMRMKFLTRSALSRWPTSQSQTKDDLVLDDSEAARGCWGFSVDPDASVVPLGCCPFEIGFKGKFEFVGSIVTLKQKICCCWWRIWYSAPKFIETETHFAENTEINFHTFWQKIRESNFFYWRVDLTKYFFDEGKVFIFPHCTVQGDCIE